MLLLLLLLSIPIANTYNITNDDDLIYQTNTDIPTVLLHGVLANKDNMNELKEMLEMNFHIKVYNLELGNGAPYSLYNSMNVQLKSLCDLIYSMDELKNGFNFIGMSQGGLLARGYVEYCNLYPVKNLITLVSPNGGIFYKNDIADNFYEPSKQEELSIADYWRDPYRYEIYKTNSTYLSQLNNEVLANTNNLDILDNFIMVWSPRDEVIEPPESAKFSMYFLENNELKLFNLEETELYQNNFLGLKTMNEQKRLYFYETDCLHSEHREPECFHKLKHIFEKFLL
jgi:palmitoyl-protein thioesterase